MNEKVHHGWAVSTTAFRQGSGGQLAIYTSILVNHAEQRAEVEEYARLLAEEQWPSSDGWQYLFAIAEITSTIPELT